VQYDLLLLAFHLDAFGQCLGRRPITLLAILMTITGSIGSALASHFAALVSTRASCSSGFGGTMSVVTTVVNDIFFLYERSEKTGVYMIFVTNGAYFAALSTSSLHASALMLGLFLRLSATDYHGTVGGFPCLAAGWQWGY
jgi:MFS family permease